MTDKVVTTGDLKPKPLFGKDTLLQHARSRFWRACNYFTIFAFVLFVYSGALVTDYLLFALMQWLLQDSVRAYPVVATWFEYAKIGLAMLFIFAAVVHGGVSTYSQVKLDVQLAREGDSQ